MDPAVTQPQETPTQETIHDRDTTPAPPTDPNSLEVAEKTEPNIVRRGTWLLSKWKQLRHWLICLLFRKLLKTGTYLPFSIPQEDFATHVEEINKYIKEKGEPSPQEGCHLDITNRILPSTDALFNLDLRYGRFRGAGLQKQNFGCANVAEADFSDADLSDANMSQVVGLQPHQLSGADLNRCSLPADIKVAHVVKTHDDG